MSLVKVGEEHWAHELGRKTVERTRLFDELWSELRAELKVAIFQCNEGLQERRSFVLSIQPEQLKVESVNGRKVVLTANRTKYEIRQGGSWGDVRYSMNEPNEFVAHYDTDPSLVYGQDFDDDDISWAESAGLNEGILTIPLMTKQIVQDLVEGLN